MEGWRHPDIALQDFMECVRAFVDILYLCSGYQSSGHPAHWDSQMLNRALQWATFFEIVLEKLPASGEGETSKQALDRALLELTSNPLFPRGLPQLSFATLANSRKVLLGNLLQALNLREKNLSSILEVVCEMDFRDLNDYSKLSGASDGLNRSAGNELEAAQKTGVSLSIERQNRSLKQAEDSLGYCALEKETINEAQNSPREFEKTEVGVKSVHDDGVTVAKENSPHRIFDFVIHEITKRRAAVNCTESLEEGLKVLADSVLQHSEVRSHHQIWEDNTNSPSTSRHDTCTLEIELWGQWKKNSLSFLLDKRTVNIVSGARLIFDATKHQWCQVLESLKGPIDKLDDGKLLEIVELCLLGLLSEKWSHLVGIYTSVSYKVFSVSKMWHYLQNIAGGNSLHGCAMVETRDSKGREIEGYLLKLLSNKVELLWKMPPVLLASSLDIRSTLFSLYMAEIQKQINNNVTTNRYFSSGYDSRCLFDCEIGERIWCIYISLDQNTDICKRST